LDGLFRRTKIIKPVLLTVRLTARDRDLLHASALHAGLSQAEYVRVAVREQATRTLAEEPAPR
jgi:uncharacterized protein (DUF1778 family)